MRRVSNLAKKDLNLEISTAPHFRKRKKENLLGPPDLAYRIKGRKKKGQVRETSTAIPAAEVAAALAAKQLLRETSFDRRLVICSSQGLSSDPLSNARNDFERLQGETPIKQTADGSFEGFENLKRVCIANS
jgi:hypothetical protein